MYRTLVIIGEISHDRANRTQAHSGGVLLRPEGAYFLIMTGRLATEYAGVDKLPDYLRSDTRDVTFLDSGHYMYSNGHY